MEQNYDVTIVGAGIAGLAAARELSVAGLRTLVLDKGRQVGGRMATRRVQGGAFDTGAQFFTAVSPGFRGLVEAAAEDGAVAQWYQRPPRKAGGEPLPVWRGSAGMTDLPKWIAEGLRETGSVDLRRSTRVTRIDPAPGGVEICIEVEDGTEQISTGAVILTPPVPQALNLLPRNLRDEIDPGITELTYDPCLALLISVDSPLLDTFNGHGWFRPTGSDERIAWVADNSRKGLAETGTQGVSRLTIHSTGEAARGLYEKDESHVVRVLGEALVELLPPRDRETLSRALAEGATQLKKWRYARPIQRGNELSVLIDSNIVLTGDAFGGGRVEGAFTSGCHGAARISRRENA